MIETSAVALLGAALSASPLVLFALASGRCPKLSPRFRLWSGRIAFLKLLLGLLPLGIWIQTRVPVGSGTGSDTQTPMLWAFLLSVWLLGVLAVLGDMASSAMRTRAVVRLAKPLAVQPEHGVQFLEVQGAACPMATGWLHPKLLLPPNFDQQAQQSAVQHELAHVRHADLVWSVFYRIVCAVFWFHPLAFVLEREVHLWQEVVADQSACMAAATSPAEHAVLILAATRNEPTALIATALSGDGRLVKRRMEAIFQQGSGSKALLLAGILIGFACLAPAWVPYSKEVRSIPARSRALAEPINAPSVEMATRAQ